MENSFLAGDKGRREIWRWGLRHLSWMKRGGSRVRHTPLNTYIDCAYDKKLRPEGIANGIVDPPRTSQQHPLETLPSAEVTVSPKAGVSIVLVRCNGPNQLSLAPIHRLEEGLEHRHVVTFDRLVDAGETQSAVFDGWVGIILRRPVTSGCREQKSLRFTS